jgi:cytochrome c-type biogenesis protein
MNVSLFLAGSAGLLSFLSPCALPLVPSYLAFVAGASPGELRGRPGGVVYTLYSAVTVSLATKTKRIR